MTLIDIDWELIGNKFLSIALTGKNVLIVIFDRKNS